MTADLHTPALDDDIPGAVNLRDLGGTPVADGYLRTGTIYRSGMMHHIPGEGLQRLAGKHGVRTVVDFRSQAELDQDGLSNFAAAGITHRHLPVSGETALTPQARAQRIRDLLTGTVSWTDSYIRIANESRHTFRDFFQVLAEDDALAVVFHCAGGRDRTGIAAGLLLSSLGATDDVAAADYARTGEILRPHAHRFTRTADEVGFTTEQMSRLVATTEPEAMLGFLRFLREEFGSTIGYLEAIGVPPQVVDDVGARLVEPRG